MNKFIILIGIISFFVMNVEAKINDNFVNALIKVESNGNDLAVGDKGKAIGCLQIWKTVIDDVNRFSKVKYTYEDRKDRNKSIEIFKIYISHYATEKRLGRKVTNEDMARIWNGGPNGYKKVATIKYWNKVKAFI